MIELAMVVLLATIPSPFNETARKELKLLTGEWEYLKGVSKDGTMDIAEMKPHFLTIENAMWEVRPKGEERVRERAAIVAIDPSTDPKIMDLKSIPLNPARAGRLIECVYKLDGDTLTIAMFVGQDKKRPSNFEDPRDAETIVWTLKRVKK